MIKEYDVEAYRSIKAPEDLKLKVLSETRKAAVRRAAAGYKAFSALAACVVLVIVCSFFFGGIDSPVTIEVDTVAVASASQRMSNCVTLVIKSEGKIEFSTSEEGFYLYDAEKNEYTQLKEIKGVKNKLAVQWAVSDTPAVITVNGEEYIVSADGNSSVSVKSVKN